MTRHYDRNDIRWDADTLKALQAAGKASYFPGLPGYVVRLDEGGSVAVRDSQIVAAQDFDFSPVRTLEEANDPMAGYSAKERYDGEDLGPHGVVYEGAKVLVEDYSRICHRDIDTRALLRRVLDDEDGELAQRLRDAITDEQNYQQAKRERETAPRPLDAMKAARLAECDALIARFTRKEQTSEDLGPR
jgi:hypothetical protein